MQTLSHVDHRAQIILRVLAMARFPLTDEKQTQAEIYAHLGAALDGEVKREVRIGARDVIDFLIGDVGVEVKLRGAGKMDIHRQLLRYAASPRIGALILATNLAMGLPALIGGKPAYFHSLGKAWL